MRLGSSAVGTLSDLTTPQALVALTQGEINLVGRMPWSSNATFLVDISPPAETERTVNSPEIVPPEIACQAVYKPKRGERPLYDFPPGLHLRERASFILSETLGWGLVPPTVIRNGPLGEGSLQLFVLADFEEHYFTIRENPDHLPALRRLCAFDVVANSTDRKSGHVLLCRAQKQDNQKQDNQKQDNQKQDNIFAIDNGLSFHEDFKLRTVLWDFSGTPIDANTTKTLHNLLKNPLPDELSNLLSPPEISAMLKRTHKLLEAGTYPTDPFGNRWPWPII